MEENESPVFRLLRKDEIPQLVRLMEDTNTSINGVCSGRLNYTICQDALLNKQVVALVSSMKGRITGYVLAVIDRALYWRNFTLRHPFMAIVVGALKIINKLAKKNKKIPSCISLPKEVSDGPSGRTWRESTPQIAKILNIGVSGDFRGKGVGKNLYNNLFRLLANRGLKRIDANISFDNLASIRLHISTGWRIEKTGSNLFATIDIMDK
ncbi:MAG: GNAT family N-acetyltransferase [Candidatus Omnitrophota bacterium]|nr:MAG: GNAT family N-acetyltransferase [Candidatus Omnitrophota bacterium]